MLRCPFFDTMIWSIELDADNRAGIPELVGDGNILAARLKRAGGMIVDTDDGSSTVGYRIGKDFARMDKAVVEQTNSNNPVAENLPGTVQRETDEMFLSFSL